MVFFMKISLNSQKQLRVTASAWKQNKRLTSLDTMFMNPFTCNC